MEAEHDCPSPGIEALADLVFVIDRDATVRSVNGAIRRVLGFEPAEVIGSSALDLVHPDDVGVAAEALVGSAGTTDGPRPRIVIRVATADGSWCRIEIAANNLLADDRIRAITIVAREVASEDAEELARRGTERRLDAAFDGTSIGMALIGPAGRFLRVNPALCRLLDYAADELISTVASELVHPDELDRGLEALAEIVSGAIQTSEEERRIRRRDGSYVWVRMAITLVRDDSGDPLYFATQIVDLSERVAIEEARRAQEERYRLIVEHTHQGVWLTDADEITTFVNPSLGAMLGYATEEMLGRHVVEFMGAEGQSEGAAHLDRRLHGFRDRHVFTVRHADGHDVWIEADASPLTHANGAYAGSITLVTDVTEERHIEAALQHERERFRTLVQESADLIIVAAADGTIDYASPAVEPVLGHRPEDLRGEPLEHLLADPTDAGALRSGTLAPASRLGDKVPNELRLKNRDGTTRYCEVVARDLTDDPNVRGVVVNARDVTDARRAERRLNALFEASNDIVTILHPDGNWYASPAGTRLLGHPQGYEPEGGIFSLVHPDDVASAAAALEEVLDGRRPESSPLEFRARTADGSYRWLEAVANDLRDDPLVAGVVITARDVTERHRIEQEQRAAEARFREAFALSPIGIGFAALDGTLTWANRALAELTGIPEDRLRGTRFQELSRPSELEHEIAQTARLLSGEITSFESEKRYDHPDGRTMWGLMYVSLVRDARGKPSQLLGQVEDVTDRKEREILLAHDAEHDNLTGLRDRTGFRRIADELWASRNPDAPVALLFADLDRFKEVNDQLGHSSGDEVLVNVGRRLRDAVRTGDTVARWGGDEFVVLCPSVTDADEALRIAGRIRRALSNPYRITAGVAEIGVSIGVALDSGQDSLATLLDDADAATYRAKLAGRNEVSVAPGVR